MKKKDDIKQYETLCKEIKCYSNLKGYITDLISAIIDHSSTRDKDYKQVHNALLTVTTNYFIIRYKQKENLKSIYKMVIQPLVKCLALLVNTDKETFDLLKYIPFHINDRIARSELTREDYNIFQNLLFANIYDNFINTPFVQVRTTLAEADRSQEKEALSTALSEFKDIYEKISKKHESTLYIKLIRSVYPLSELILHIRKHDYDKAHKEIILIYQKLQRSLAGVPEDISHAIENQISPNVMQFKAMQLVLASESRLATPSKTTHKNWNRKLTSLQQEISDITKKSFSEDEYSNLIEPAIKILAKVFLMQPIAFVKAKYAAISICEEILYRFDADALCNIKIYVYYHLANFNSHTKHDVWRNSVYASQLKDITVKLSDIDISKVQNPGDQTYSGLARYTQSTHSTSLAEISDFKSDIRLKFLRKDFTLTDSSLFDEQLPKFLILTGRNGSRKTHTLDFIFNLLRKANFASMIESKTDDFKYVLYVESEATMYRKIRGTSSYDFKYEYVYEKLKGYLSFDENNLREDVIHTINDNINTKIAIAIVDRYFFGYKQRLYITEIIANSWKKLSDQELSQFKKITIAVAEELFFSENLLQEPVTIVENIFKQHLNRVHELFIKDLFDSSTQSRLISFLFTGILSQELDHLYLLYESKFTKKRNFKKIVEEFSQQEWHQDYQATNILSSVLAAFSKHIEYNPQRYYEICSEYCARYHEITPPNKIIDSMVKKYLKDYSISFEWDRAYSNEFYIQLRQVTTLEEALELNTLYISQSESSLRYKIKFWDDEQLTFKDEELILPPIISDQIQRKISDTQMIDKSESEAIYSALSDQGIVPTGKYRFIFKKHGIPIELHSLSSGELVAIRLIFWSYASRGLDFIQRESETFEKPFKSKIKLLLLDEVDKHFDSRLTRTLISIIQNEFLSHNVRVIMTTHKPDTLTLSWKKEAIIFTIKQELLETEIIETHPLLAMFRLSGNLREITGHRYIVYTESRNDALLYDGVYKTLIRYCNYLRENNVIAEWQRTESFLDNLLSRRFQCSFTSVSSDGDGSGGCKDVVDYIASDITAYQNFNRYSVSQGINSLANLFESDLRLCSSYGVLDNDYGKKHDCSRIYKAEGRTDPRVIILERHSIENYIFDPLILSCLLENEIIFNKIKESVNGNQGREKTFRSRLLEICIEIKDKLDDSKIEQIDALLQEYFTIVIFDLLKAPTTQDIIYAIKEKKWFFLKANNNLEQAEIIAFRLYGTLKAILSSLNEEDVSILSLDRKKYFDEILEQGVLLEENDYKQFDILWDVIKPERLLQYRKIDEVRDARNILVMGDKKIKIILSETIISKEFTYPKLFYEMRGHDLEENIFGKKIGKKLTEMIAAAIYSNGLKYIPLDLAVKIFELNSSIRTHVREVLKPYSLKKITWVEKIHDLELSRLNNYADIQHSGSIEEKKVDGSLNLRRTEKILLEQSIFRAMQDKSVITSLKLDVQTIRDHVYLVGHMQNCGATGNIKLLPEICHSTKHKINVRNLIKLVDVIKSSTVICLERKQHGNNLGMLDVIVLADHLEQGNILPSTLQLLPIYYDALLYNAARTKGIQVIGVEGKGLAYSKESPHYQQAREEYMAEQLLAIARSGKNAIFLVGAAHINNLIKLLGTQGFAVDDSDSSLGQNLIALKPNQAIFAQEPISSGVSTDLVRIDNIEYRAETNPQLETENLVYEAVQSYAFLSYMHEFAEQLDLNWQVQKILHLTALWKFESLKEQYGITASFDAFRGSNSDFRKSVLLKLHPDKNPSNPDCNDDFIFVTNLREELNKPFDVQKFINEKIQTIQPFIYKAHIGFKAFDITIDATRLIYTPTIDNAKKVLIDSAHIYSMHSGINGVSTIINGVDALYKVYQGEYGQALTQGLTTTGYMLVPAAISFVAIPYIGFIYGVTLTIYSGYGAITNAYSFYQEYYEENSGLRSITAYKNLFETLSSSPLQYVYDFSKTAKEYEAKTNNIKLELEKAHIKGQLEEKGEFGQKLYEYIYTRVIEEKYELQSKVTQGILTQEDAEALEAKHIKVLDYDHCMEVMELKEEQSDHYYCYNEEQEILDHIIITGETYIEKIGSL